MISVSLEFFHSVPVIWWYCSGQMSFVNPPSPPWRESCVNPGPDQLLWERHQERRQVQPPPRRRLWSEARSPFICSRNA